MVPLHFDLPQMRGTEEQPCTAHPWDQSLGPEVQVINVSFGSAAGGQTFLWSNFRTFQELRKGPVSLERCAGVLTSPPRCCGLSGQRQCCSASCDGLGDVHLLLLFILES